jgi:hypothetical protein
MPVPFPRRSRAPFGLLPLLALVVFLAACSDRGGGESISTRVDRPSFPADSAFALLKKQVEFGPRIPGTEAHAAQLAWMKTYLQPRADTVIVQDFPWTTTTGETLQLTNLFVRFRPELKDRILLVTHWDTRPKANESRDSLDREKPVPGANDAASGTAVLMQLANLLQEKAPPIGVDLLFVDGEDYGPGDEDMYLGARYFVAHQPAGYSPLYGVLLDMIGDEDPRFPVEYNSQQLAPEVVQRVWSIAHDLGYGDIFPNTPGPSIIDDHITLNQAGIRTADIIDFDYPYWHTPEDTPEHTSPKGLGIVGEVMAELIFRGG